VHPRPGYAHETHTWHPDMAPANQTFRHFIKANSLAAASLER